MEHALIAHAWLGSGRAAVVREAAWCLRAQQARLPEIARELWISERQLRRRFARSVGYGWATFKRIQRFQRLLLIADGARAAGEASGSFKTRSAARRILTA